jgi:hypothetical protein
MEPPHRVLFVSTNRGRAAAEYPKSVSLCMPREHFDLPINAPEEQPVCSNKSGQMFRPRRGLLPPLRYP